MTSRLIPGGQKLTNGLLTTYQTVFQVDRVQDSMLSVVSFLSANGIALNSLMSPISRVIPWIERLSAQVDLQRTLS
jgi:hypothetical protein